ncbi:lytic murein transglycosylase [Dinoroseobacter shibae DFL 12 = DSM 16493]|jgi:lytic murein transglycosylase|uniref:Lytic murein transglycosylase n=1 Tax=Dinoroseobacter shibae (strain DSM 16493 / NCIMB 14021 / DFL 12) TaxID=398580 RepID=A8LKS0_DINSH|nr:lytic murein transglycosylase [Dinoroseobacter shibae]ABV91913.1 lytic murein transglycosylase [Dinoroseobacter shibae DFL 12 = DSM 16493]URF46888.1 lytic murein transglycosylase [Dinoroseobacter shibae]URF51199.1 lytic murein transglycosylase [Dinoroseobacter shibae]
MLRFSLLLLLSFGLAGPVAAQCGGSFSDFVAGLKTEAQAKGHAKATVDAFFRTAAQDPRTLRADRAQGVFKMPFTEFARRVISQNRMDNGRRNADRFDAVFDAAETRFGVPRGVLLALWALETDYGAVQGDFNTLNSLVTLAHDCRRPELFRPQIFAALELYEAGDFDPARTTGAWAGEIGMVQMLPEDILTKGIDGDGDGHVYLKTSAPDALLSGANMLSGLGWRKGEPWLQEVSVPADLDWAETGLNSRKSGRDWARLGVTPRWGEIAGGLEAALILPQGRKGPAFLAYPNFDVFFEWNQSFVYVTTAAYFATRLSGAPVFDAGNPEPGLNDAQMKQLQQKLAARGYDVGAVDGILGARTRAAVRAEQQRLGLPADAWPTPALLGRL